MSMEIADRLNVARDALIGSGLDEDVLTPEDVVKIAGSKGKSDIDSYHKVIGTAIYIRARLIDRLSYYEAFKLAFPERCIFNGDDNDINRMNAGEFKTDKAVGSELSRGTIVIKAKRLESSELYKQMVLLLQTDLFISYAVDRYKVVDAALEVALDENTPLRDRDRYMKLFLEETRKNEQMRGLEVNVNLGSNESIRSIDDKLTALANKLEGKSASEIIDATVIPE